MVWKAIVGLTALASAAPALSAWDFDTAVDPMTDATRGLSILRGGDDLLVIKCDGNGPGSLYISFLSGDYIGSLSSNRNRQIKYRFDGGEIQTINAIHERDYLLIGDVKPGSSGGRLLARLAESKSLVVQAHGYDYQQHTFQFETTGAAEAIQKAATTCGDTNWIQQPNAE